MNEVLVILDALYLTGGAATLGYLASLASRWLPGWLWANRPHDLQDWIISPFVLLLAAVIALPFILATWPVALVVVALEKKRLRQRRRAIEEKEEAALFEEARRFRESALESAHRDEDGEYSQIL